MDEKKRITNLQNLNDELYRATDLIKVNYEFKDDITTEIEYLEELVVKMSALLKNG